MLISDEIQKITTESSVIMDVTPVEYASMKYPRLIPLMRFSVRQFLCHFGNLALMDTNALGGRMLLSTAVFTPDTGMDLPVLLIDGMKMKNKCLMYVEYYDCTKGGARLPSAETQKDEFSYLADYPEKDAWYIKRRMPCSLIKGGENASEEKLREMAVSCVRRYLDAAENSDTHPENFSGLRTFQEQMWTLGNPSVGTMTKVLGKEGAERFFKAVIMPCERVR